MAVDFIYGACYVCAGASNGKLNVSPGDVLRVCMLPTITTKGVRRIILNHHLDQLSTRQAQRLAKAAMYAVRGIGLFLERHPAELAVLEYEMQFASAYQDEVTAPTEATLGKEIQLTTDIREEHLTEVLRIERKYQLSTLLAA